MAERRLLLVQAVTPPYPGGTNTILHRLLHDLPGWEVEVVADRAVRRHLKRDRAGRLGGRYRHFFKLPPWRPVAGLVHVANLPLALIAGIRAALVARRNSSTVILTTLDGGFSQLAAATAARLAGLPLMVFVFDLWEENAYGRVELAVARRFERRLLQRAAAVVVFCDTAADHYSAKHGIRANVLQIPLDPADVPGSSPLRALPEEGPVEVFVAGALYWAQEEAVRRIAAAVKQVEDARLTLIGDEQDLRARGIEADRYEPRLGGPDFRARVERADVVALGLSLESRHPDVVRTATPARLVDYMASGRPLLIHAPSDSHVATYARDEGFAEVVCEADTEAVADALRRLISDRSRAGAYGARARLLAADRHDPLRARQELTELLARISSDAVSR